MNFLNNKTHITSILINTMDLAQELSNLMVYQSSLFQVLADRHLLALSPTTTQTKKKTWATSLRATKLSEKEPR